jgi:hypothetical protein
MRHYASFELTQPHFEKAFQAIGISEACAGLRNAKATFQYLDAGIYDDELLLKLSDRCS